MSNFTNISKGYLVKDPSSRTHGETTFTTVTIVDNPIGEKAKERYIPLFIDVTFTGRRGEIAQGLKKGDMIATRGWVGLRTYEKKSGGFGVQGEMQYPESLTLLSPRAEEGTVSDAPPAKVVAVPVVADPFA